MTGRTKVVEQWETLGVEIREPGPDEERDRVSETGHEIIRRERRLLTLWMSEQPEVDLHGFCVLLVSSIDWYLARSGGDSGLFRAMTAIHEGRVQDLPAGFPVEVEFPDDGPGLTVRLVEYRPIGDPMFEIPSGYEELDRTKRQRHR